MASCTLTARWHEGDDVNSEEFRDEIANLIRMLNGTMRLEAVYTMRDLFARRIGQVLGDDSPYVEAVLSVQPTEPPRPWYRSVFTMKPEYRMSRNLQQLLTHLHFALGLDATGTSSTRPPPLDTDVRERLTTMLDAVAGEVGGTPLDPHDRAQILDALARARRIVAGEIRQDDPHRGLQELLGEAVVKVGRGGVASPLWRRVAEVIVVAEATVSLGLGVAAVTSAQTTTEVTVTCRITPPALPAGPTATPR